MTSKKRDGGDDGCKGCGGGCGGGGCGGGGLVIVILLLTTQTLATTSTNSGIQIGSVDVSASTHHHNGPNSHHQTHLSYQPHPYREVTHAQDNTHTHGRAFSHQDSHSHGESYKEGNLHQTDDVHENDHHRQDGMFHRPTPLPPPSMYYDSHRPNPLPPSTIHHNPHNPQYFYSPVRMDYVSRTHNLQPFRSPISTDFNTSSLPPNEDVRARGSYLLRSGEGFLQTPRTWTAGPKTDHDDTTTRDPAIPVNPEGLQNPSLLVGPWEEEPTLRSTKAIFKGVNGSVVEVQSGTTASIPCVIHNKADHEMVSWIRLRDHHLITVGRQTYTNDDRFSVTYNRHRQEWTLQVRYAHERDAGVYVCQLSTHPPMVFTSTLTVTKAWSEIGGGPERYVHEGSSVTLNCTLHQHTQPPQYVFWYHNRTMINFHTARQVSVHNTGDGSLLTLTGVGRKDSGNYTCHPPNSTPASITLHIIAGEAPAAMQVSGTWRHQDPDPHLLLALLLPFSTCLHLTQSS